MSRNDNNPETGEVRWVNKRELARHFACSPRTINNLMARRILPYSRIGKILRFDLAACDRAMQRFRTRSVGE